MSEKTAEEKLREELEGSAAKSPKREESARAKPVRKTRTAGRKSERPERVGQLVDSFMEDFEKRVEESLNAGKPAKTQPKPPKPRVSRKSSAVQTSAEQGRKNLLDIDSQIRQFIAAQKDTEQPKQPEPQESPESVDVITESPEPAESSEPQEAHEESPTPVEAITESSEPQEPVEPEPAPETLTDSSELQELTQDSDTLTEPETDDSQDEPSEIPVDLVDVPDEEIDAEIDNELPGIPVLDAEEINSLDNDSQSDLPDIPVIAAETPEPPADLAEIDDDLEEFSEEPDPSIPAQDFLPPADVVVNVDSELPQIDTPPQEIDPESESSPVSVTMPESTKTAEDKLMADIAEAMTGSPLTLDSADDSQPYRLPEDFFSANQESITNPQSAEDKLIANISQAMTESPIGIAQDNASQNLEEDLNPFDEMPLPEPTPSFDFANEEVEEPQEDDEEEEPFLPDLSAYTEQSEPESDSQEDSEPEQDVQDVAKNSEDAQPEDTQEVSDPFTIPDFGDDDSDSEPEHDSEPDSDADSEPEPELPQETPVELTPDEEKPDIQEDPETLSEPLTAEDRLAQELAAFSQQDTRSEEINPDEAQEDIFAAQTINEEADQTTNMPDQNLLDDGAMPDIEDDDDFMSSLGDAASIYDEDTDHPHEEFSEPEPEYSPEPEITPSASFIANAGEQKETEKTMDIRGKLKAKKEGASSSASPSSPGILGRILTPILLAGLLIVGVLLLLKLYEISDYVTAAAMSGESFGSVSAVETAPVYDYAIDFILDPNMTERMAARGREGWQVVGSRRTQDSTSGQYGYEFIFMRRVKGR